ncbi:transcription factor HES-5-like [Periophthalmus magnuspinnatus]|uniref:transcription factor HES-5-like n=1 Tax=Periophthalmus magnuspinnatus TaxID=409849 RepID=UPI00145B08E9|nr:transcription factor HES-5-like [Periophthalmus magnuspinnatus]XP_033822190.1 transcription factor HES-5-like [Periophthalmus magnuspinnatus]XP_033822191.1 transcription factor HES-5-like [Periophthalmus magnuspinnatus]XP_033822871.1 transcription factor HES-5-like [Periophthalmus magnuspinnatus]
MAPTITAAMGPSQDHLSVSHKLRKPVVEKLRRERINSSIEQLKSLLCAEFLQQQPDSKLEKADVLEMTVTVLTRLQQHNNTHFMSQSHMKSPQQSHREALFCLQSSTSKDKRAESSAPWRPW